MLDGARVQDPFDLSSLEVEIAKYKSHTQEIIIKSFELQNKSAKIKLANNDQNNIMSAEEVKTAFKSFVNELATRDEALLNQLIEIRLHEVYDESELLAKETLPVQIGDFSINRRKDIKIVFEKKSEFSDLMELARLIATKEYVTLRREKTNFVSTFYSTHAFEPSISQYLHMYWPYVSIEAYSNSSVGLPSLIIKDGNQIHSVPLTLGTKVSLWVFARCCIGRIDSENEPYTCSAIKVRRFGMILPLHASDARCKRCLSGFDRLKFSRKSIKKLAEENPEEDPLETFGDDQFYIYITRFGNHLKVGRARLSRGVSRLLEQSCLDALVIYPILSYVSADTYEEEVKNAIKARITSLAEYGIEKVYGRAYTNDKIETIRRWHTGNFMPNDQLYKEIIKLLEDSSVSRTLHLTNRKYINLSENWMLSSELNLSKSKEIVYPFSKVEGVINGVVGSYVFLDNGNFLDLEKLDGCLFRGNGFS